MFQLSRHHRAAVLSLLMAIMPANAAPGTGNHSSQAGPAAAKSLSGSWGSVLPRAGNVSAVVLFGDFAGALGTRAPEWSAQLLDPQHPGSLSHFYGAMSFGQLRVRGGVAPGLYRASGPVAGYLAASRLEPGYFGRFCMELGALVTGHVADAEDQAFAFGAVDFQSMQNGQVMTALLSQSGRFALSLRPGRYRAWFDLLAIQDEKEILVTDDQEVEFIAKREVRVTGCLREASGAPIVGGRLLFVPTNGYDRLPHPIFRPDGTLKPFLYGVSDADGMYEIYVVPGKYRVVLTNRSPDRTRAWDCEVGDLETNFDINLEQGSAVIVQLEADHRTLPGTPLEELTLCARAHDGRFYERQQADGTCRFELDLPKGRYDLELTDSGGPLSVTWRIAQIEVPPGDLIPVRRPGGVLFTGRVTDERGAPQRAQVILMTPRQLAGALSEDQFVARTETAWDSGQFEMAIDPGKYEVVVLPYLRPGRVLRAVDLSSDRELDVALPFSSLHATGLWSGLHTIMGLTLDQTGNRLPNALLTLHDTAQDIIVRSLASPAGEYAILLPAGDYRATLAASGGACRQPAVTAGTIRVAQSGLQDIELLSATAVGPSTPQAAPGPWVLEQNYPNPFNGSTLIRFVVPARASVALDIYNLLGQRVVSLVDTELEQGACSCQWDGTDDAGRHLTSGMYFCRLQAGAAIRVRKLVLIK
jgi:hypothetical protein